MPAGSCSKCRTRHFTWDWRHGSGPADFRRNCPGILGTSCTITTASDLLVGLLTPPVGPDLAFVQELLGAYAWTAFALVVVTALLGRGSWKVSLVIAPLLLTAGAWTWTSLGGGILQLAVPSGLPAADVGAALASFYWPPLGPSWPSETAALHDVWTPAFTLGYALTFVVLERAARSEGLSWPSVLVLAGIVGFVGILVTSLVPVLIVLWAALAAVHVVQNRRGRAVGAARRWGAGLGLAAVLLLFGGGAFTAFLDGGPSTSLALTWDLNRTHWEALGTFDAPLGGVGVLGLGPLVIAGFAVLLARRDRLVLTLAAGAGLLVLGWLVLSYPTAPWVLSRLAGHARNLALVALLLALTGVFSARLAKPLRHSREGGNPAPGEPGAARDSTMESFARLCLADVRRCGLSPALWRSSLAVLLVGLIVWPTIAAPVRSLGHAVGSGVQLANAAWVQQEMRRQEPADRLRRFQLPAMSDRLASDIRDHTSLHARVLTPEWPHWAVSLATGRPNGAGFADLHHLIYFTGPEYLDARNNLEPGAIRRLGIEYVHATDAWAAGLPPRARRWLADPDLFELVARDGTEALYRIRQAFLELDVEPQPESFEALRSGAVVDGRGPRPGDHVAGPAARGLGAIPHAAGSGDCRHAAPAPAAACAVDGGAAGRPDSGPGGPTGVDEAGDVSGRRVATDLAEPRHRRLRAGGRGRAVDPDHAGRHGFSIRRRQAFGPPVEFACASWRSLATNESWTTFTACMGIG